MAVVSHSVTSRVSEKSEGHVKLALNGILAVFDMYGMGVYIPEAINQIIEEFKRWEDA